MPDKTYVVQNPRGIPVGIPILSFRPPDALSQDWYEGGTFVRPTDMPLADVSQWVKSGFLEEQ